MSETLAKAKVIAAALRQQAYASGDETELAAASMMDTLIAELRIFGHGKKTPDYRRGYIAGWTAFKKGHAPTVDVPVAQAQESATWTDEQVRAVHEEADRFLGEFKQKPQAKEGK